MRYKYKYKTFYASVCCLGRILTTLYFTSKIFNLHLDSTCTLVEYFHAYFIPHAAPGNPCYLWLVPAVRV